MADASACRRRRPCRSRSDRSGAGEQEDRLRPAENAATALGRLVRSIVARDRSTDWLAAAMKAVEDQLAFGIRRQRRLQRRQPLLIGQRAVAQALAKHRLEVGESVEAEMMGKTHQRRGLHLGRSGDAGSGAEGDLVGVVERIGGHLRQAFRQRFSRSMIMRPQAVEVARHAVRWSSVRRSWSDRPRSLRAATHTQNVVYINEFMFHISCEMILDWIRFVIAADRQAGGDDEHSASDLIGTGFMGKCHALAWNSVATVFGDVRAVAARASRRGATPELARRPRRVNSASQRRLGDWRDRASPTRTWTSSRSPRRTSSTPKWRSPRSTPASMSGARSRWRRRLPRPERMRAAASASGKVAVLGYNYIQNPAIRHIRKLLDEEAIGAVNHVRIEMDEDFMADPDAPFWQRSEAVIG